MAITRSVPLAILLLTALAPGCADANLPRPTWSEHVHAVDDALARDDVSGALQAWHNGYSAALRSGGWPGLVELGHAYLRIPLTRKPPASPKPVARQAYLLALVRAQAQGSVRGTLLVANAFAELGDAQVAASCVKIAEGLARRHGDRAMTVQVTLERERLARRVAASQEPGR